MTITEPALRRQRRDIPSPRSTPRERWSLAGSALMTGVLVVLIGIGLLAIVVPAATGSTALTVLTSSMEPHLPPGTMVVVRPTPADEITPGEIVTYQLRSGEPTLVTHRVTQTLRTTDGGIAFVTQGDANPQPDPDLVQPVQVRGTVWYAIPLLGWVATSVAADQRSVVVIVAVVGLFGYAVWAFASALRDRARRGRTSASLPAGAGPTRRDQRRR